ncbi:unnamed protein product [Penicillium roqueforti FM164]|uniref:Genomic scaffold, ProqFM164S02 n=1 Tax=Penicillium roqueforti (strain FM164) TaxID=1365484 RepID=W6Q7X5_PENRF|nr:unnamed protein product [Penicillium roqueforti FM164]
MCPHWHLEPWQPAAHPPSVPLVTGESAVECPRQLSSTVVPHCRPRRVPIVPGESGVEVLVS